MQLRPTTIKLTIAALVAIGIIISACLFLQKPAYIISIGENKTSMPFGKTGKQTQQDMVKIILPLILSLDIGHSTPVIECTYTTKHDTKLPIPGLNPTLNMTVKSSLGRFYAKRESQSVIGIYFLDSKSKATRFESDITPSETGIRNFLEQVPFQEVIINANFMPKATYPAA